MAIRLHSSVSTVKGVGDQSRKALGKYGIETVLDLLYHFPLLYIDFQQPAPRVALGEKKLYRVEVLDFNVTRAFRRRNLSILRVSAEVAGEPVQLVFFNQSYLADKLAEISQIYIYGTFEIQKGVRQANTPMVFTAVPEEPVIPLYGKLGTLKTGKLRNIIRQALDTLDDDYETLPRDILKRYGFPPMVEALAAIHFPQGYDPEELHRLKKRFIYNEFFFFQLELQYIRRFFKTVPRVRQYSIGEEEKSALKELLPFTLTPDQQQACRDIFADMNSGFTMQRLLQGDVGTGKTVVAFIALWLALRGGFQGAFLAPTEILARQHFANGRAFFKSAPIELLTGSTSTKERKEILRRLGSGETGIIFGTHALLNDKVKFKNLAMVVVDEQHRFGVSQRAALYYKGNAVDLLVTTATPIPRTMLLSLYNDLGVSVIKSKPRGRLPIITKIMDGARRDEFYLWLRKEIRGGHKVYIILPLVEDSEFFTELHSVESQTAYFKKMFQSVAVGFVSGRTAPEEKDRIIGEFTRGEIKVLVSTTVIEVGIDVPDATIMVIENADRYGLSQLHQLRGRVGRGELQSYCYLFASPNLTPNGRRRLKTIAATEDGFKIAETDLKMRGGGIITGFEQSGYLDFRVGNVQDHQDIFEEARGDAAGILEDESRHTANITGLLHKIRDRLKDINFS